MADNTLSIVTALSRIENLDRIVDNIKKSFHRIDMRWYCLFDPVQVTTGLTFDAYRSGYACDGDIWGNTQKSQGLEEITDGWVYFLDDDNLIHHEFEAALLLAIEEHPSAKGFVFNQLDTAGKQLRQATRENYTYGKIDLGQFVLRRSLIGDNRFVLADASSDWYIFEAAALPFAEEVIPIDKDVTYYNYLRPR